MLIKLPNGEWIDPARIIAIKPVRKTEGMRETVYINMEFGVNPSIEFSKGKGFAFADELARIANEGK